MGSRIESIPSATMDALGRTLGPATCASSRTSSNGPSSSPGPHLDLSGWLPTSGAGPGGRGIRTLEELEREHILAVLGETGWQVSGARGAATLLGIKPTTLEARMKKLGIRRP